MILLLDTHTFMWWDSNPANLSPRALTELRDPANTKWISVVSIWEMVIKSQLGKLTLRLPMSQIVARQQANGLQVLAVSLAHVLAVEGLPAVHKDPFDRLLAAQANVEAAEFVTADPIFARYPVRVLW
ncbi:MAG: type II toxin-antitoxin system VapC family toxin [Gemmataceae bacterium]